MSEEKELILEDIVKKCLDSEGYVIFAAILGPPKDKVTPLEFYYKRYQLSYEAAYEATRAFKSHLNRDVRERIGIDENDPATPETK